MITRRTVDGMGWATYSDDLVYRYTLGRCWDNVKASFGRILWIMLNPSTATEEDFDPTVRRCYGYSRAWRFASMEVVNLFALRSTDPRKLLTAEDPIGPYNDRAIARAIAKAKFVVAAWGCHALVVRRQRDLFVLKAMMKADKELHALKTTKSGAPSHPLYLSSTLRPVAYPGRPHV